MKKHRFELGQIVRYGKKTGKIKSEWGSFQGCPVCAKLISKPCDKTPCCGVTTVTIDGRGIFEVEFKGERPTSINGCWLKASVSSSPL